MTEKTKKSRNSILINLNGVENEEIRDYTVNYKLLDASGPEFKLTDYYTLVLKDGIPTQVRLLVSDNGIYSLK